MRSRPDPIDVEMPDDSEMFARWPDDHPVSAGASSRTLPFFLASDLAGLDVPERKWVVPEFIPFATVTTLSADGATGKSLAALQLGVAMSTGQSWLGLETAAGRVLYLSAEDDRDEIHRRLANIVAASPDIELEDLGALKIVPLAGEDAVLGAPSGKGGVIEATPLWKLYEAAAIEWKPALVINDTLADIFGGDENVRAQARQFIGMMRGLAIRTGAAVLLLAHPSLSGMASGTGTSGSTGWNNSVRSRLYFSRIKDEDGKEPDPDARVLSVMKANYSRNGTELRLKWEEGVFVPMDAPSVSGMNNMAAQARAERIFMEMLDAYLAEGRPVSATPSANYAPAVFAKDPRASGLTKKGFTSAMNFLFQSRQIAVGEFGPPSKRRSQIIRAERSEEAE